MPKILGRKETKKKYKQLRKSIYLKEYKKEEAKALRGSRKGRRAAIQAKARKDVKKAYMGKRERLAGMYESAKVAGSDLNKALESMGGTAGGGSGLDTGIDYAFDVLGVESKKKRKKKK